MLAEKKIGMEIIAAQQRGELARADGSTHHRPKEGTTDADTFPTTLGDIGITSQQAHQFRQMAALSEEDMEDAKERGSPVRR